MAPQFDRALRELLRAAGCVLVRQGKGSHQIWHSPVTGRNFPAPVGNSKPPHGQCDFTAGRSSKSILNCVAIMLQGIGFNIYTLIQATLVAAGYLLWVL